MTGQLDPQDCPHHDVHLQASVSGGDVPWHVLAPAPHPVEGTSTRVNLGVCGSCGSQMVSVRIWRKDARAPDSRWSSRWVRLSRDGEQ